MIILDSFSYAHSKFRTRHRVWYVVLPSGMTTLNGSRSKLKSVCNSMLNTFVTVVTIIFLPHFLHPDHTCCSFPSHLNTTTKIKTKLLVTEHSLLQTVLTTSTATGRQVPKFPRLTHWSWFGDLKYMLLAVNLRIPYCAQLLTHTFSLVLVANCLQPFPFSLTILLPFLLYLCINAPN